MTEVKTAGQIALVTGASRGIGRAIAHTLAAQGMKVIGTATTDAGAAAIGESLAAFEGCRGLCLNVNDGPALDAAIEAIVKEHGALHVLVNNAGITHLIESGPGKVLTGLTKRIDPNLIGEAIAEPASFAKIMELLK